MLVNYISRSTYLLWKVHNNYVSTLLIIVTDKNLHAEMLGYIKPRTVWLDIESSKKKGRMGKRKWRDNQRRVFARDTSGLLFSFSPSNHFFPTTYWRTLRTSSTGMSLFFRVTFLINSQNMKWYEVIRVIKSMKTKLLNEKFPKHIFNKSLFLVPLIFVSTLISR